MFSPTVLPASSGGTKNYLGTVNGTNSNGDFETGSTSPWVKGNVSALTNNFPSNTSPTFGSGASANLTLSTVSSGQLAGTYSLSFASSAATVQGDFLASQAITIDKEDQSKQLQFKFYYSAISNPSNGNWSGTSSNSFGVAIWDVTNSAWIQPTGCFSMIQSSGVGIASGTWQTPSNMTQFRFVVYNANASSGAITLYFDDFFCGPQVTASGFFGDDWKTYTPTFTGFGTVSSSDIWSRRVGDTLQILGKFTAGTATSTEARMTLGWNGVNSNVIADATKVPSIRIVGSAARSSAAAVGFFITAESGIGYLTFSIQDASRGGLTKQNGDQIASAVTFSLYAEIPISGWSSNVLYSPEGGDGRLVAAIISGDPASATSGNPIIVPTVGYDSHTAYNASTGRYTVPVTGIYKMFGALQSASSATTLTIYKNASSAALAGNLDSNGEATFCGAVSCIAGDIIDLRPGGTVDATNMTLNIERLSGPSAIAAAETVACRYTNTSGQAITTASTAVITGWTKVYDTHSAFNASSGVFTVPVSGKYRITAHALSTSVAQTVGSARQSELQVSGTQSTSIGLVVIWASITTYQSINGTVELDYKAGDTISISLANASGTTFTMYSSDATENWVCISRIGN